MNYLKNGVSPSYSPFPATVTYMCIFISVLKKPDEQGSFSFLFPIRTYFNKEYYKVTFLNHFFLPQIWEYKRIKLNN